MFGNLMFFVSLSVPSFAIIWTNSVFVGEMSLFRRSRHGERKGSVAAFLRSHEYFLSMGVHSQVYINIYK